MRTQFFLLPPTLALFLLASGCGKATCGLTESRAICNKLYAKEVAGNAIGIRSIVTRPAVTPQDTASVLVIAKNLGTKTWTIPTQRCVTSFELFAIGSEGDGPGERIYPSANFICNGDNYPGATLAPGDSVIWKSDLMNILRMARKNGELLGEYSITGRVKVDDVKVIYATSVDFRVVEKP